MDEQNIGIGTTETGKTPSMRDFNTMFGIVIGVAIVCTVAFVSLISSYFSERSSAYEDLKDQIVAQNAKIDSLTDEIHRSQPICTDQKIVE